MTTSQDSFSQSRKASAEPCSPQVREHLDGELDAGEAALGRVKARIKEVRDQ